MSTKQYTVAGLRKTTVDGLPADWLTAIAAVFPDTLTGAYVLCSTKLSETVYEVTIQGVHALSLAVQGAKLTAFYKLVLDTATGTSLVEVYYWGIACTIPEAHIPVGAPSNTLGSSVLHSTPETLSLYLALNAGIPDVELNRLLGLWGLDAVPAEAHTAKADFIDGFFSGATYYTWTKS